MKIVVWFSKWAGPVTIGAFSVVAITGVLMLFGGKFGKISLAHEWIGLLLCISGIAHIVVNWRAFVGYFKKPIGFVLIIIPLALGCLSFIPSSGSSGPRLSNREVTNAIEQSSLALVAPIAKKKPMLLLEELNADGIRVRDAEQTIREIASENGIPGAEVLNRIFGKQNARSDGKPK